MSFFSNLNIQKCPICGTEYQNERKTNICSTCKYPIESQSIVEPINWGKDIWRTLEQEKLKLKEKQSDRESSLSLEIFQKTIEQLFEPINNLSHEIQNLTQEIRNSNQQKQDRSSLTLNNNYQTEANLELSRQNNNLVLDDEREYVEPNQNKNNNLYSQNNLSNDNSSIEITNNNLNNTLRFVEEYNRDKHSLFNKAIATVSETDESMNNRRDARYTPVQLEVKGSRGSYWIIDEDKNNYLVPTSDIKINLNKLDTVQALFDCFKYYEGYSNFQLTKPAKVLKLSDYLWQLEERGELFFY
ncbi:MAG: hypothetical protein ACRC2R_14770 [Xenococcaceae cyanobacterium]